jgi:hypothetical protein
MLFAAKAERGNRNGSRQAKIVRVVAHHLIEAGWCCEPDEKPAVHEGELSLAKGSGTDHDDTVLIDDVRPNAGI